MAPDPLAQSEIRSIRGEQWHHFLAAYIRGEMTHGELSKHADTSGKKTEALFYRADKLAASAPQVPRAKNLWRAVVASGMLAFFEFDMAKFNLIHGPAVVETNTLQQSRAAEDTTSR